MILVPLIVLLVPWVPLHPNSWSRSVIEVDEAGVTVSLSLQTLSVMEVVELDADDNLLIEPDELTAVQDDVLAYVLDHYVLRPLEGEAVEPLAGELRSMVLRTDDTNALAFAQYVDLELRFDTPRLVPLLDIEMTLFFETSPRHQDACDVHWPDGTRTAARFWRDHPRQVFRADTPPPARSVTADLILGGEHIVFGYDHLAFILGLLVASARLRSLIGVVTAFTVAHSVTLTLAALDVVAVPVRPVEIFIGVSIAWVGLLNLVRRRPRPLWIEAFVFGLIHGLGFASALGEFLVYEAERLRTLVLFNLGIEIGQIAIVLAVLLVVKLGEMLVPGRRGATAEATEDGTEDRWLVPAAIRTAVSLGVLVCGSYWAAERWMGP